MPTLFNFLILIRGILFISISVFFFSFWGGGGVEWGWEHCLGLGFRVQGPPFFRKKRRRQDAERRAGGDHGPASQGLRISATVVQEVLGYRV